MGAVKLSGPPEYFDASADARAEICSGCGPEGFFGKLVPDTLYGLSITEACNIHDWRYARRYNRWLADAEFLANMLSLIESRPWSPLKPLRRYRAITYYSVVREFGIFAYGEDDA